MADLVGPALLTVFFAGTIGLFSWPLEYFGGVNLFVAFFIVWSRIWRSFVPNIEEPFRVWSRQAIRIGPPAIVGMFLYGSIDAGIDLKRTDQPYIFRLKQSDHGELRIFLRNFDKGVLVRNVSDNRIEFYKWENIDTVARIAPQQSRTALCWMTGWPCKEQPRVIEP
jgi:hypothetical protein